ncbi:hypothetical protein Hanom_Chr12g01165211 [Helianthus anomalus]
MVITISVFLCKAPSAPPWSNCLAYFVSHLLPSLLDWAYDEMESCGLSMKMRNPETIFMGMIMRLAYRIP